MPDLHLEKFQLQEDGTWLNQRASSEAIKLLVDKADYKLILPNERKSYIFDSEGKLISIQQNNQKPVKITYQGKFIQHITLSCGQEIRFAYSHHKYNAADYPHLVDDERNIYPVTREEHQYRWHGGKWTNDTSGEPLNPNYLEEIFKE